MKMNFILATITLISSVNTKLPMTLTSNVESKIDSLILSTETYKHKITSAEIDDILDEKLAVFFVSENNKDFNNNIFANYSLNNVDVKPLATYFFKDRNGNRIQGTILSDDNSIDQLETKITEINDDIITNLSKQSLKNDMLGLSVGDGWNLLGSEQKVDWITSSGEFSEWRSAYAANGRYGGSDYYAFTFETYIKPNANKYRSQSLEYKLNPSKSKLIEIRDYAPKVKNPSSTVSYTTSSGYSVNDKGVSFNTSISNSYSTLVESPKIIDKGSMASNTTNILLEYTNYKANKGTYYDYNVNQSYQSSSFIFRDKTPDDGASIIFEDVRIIKFYNVGGIFGIGSGTSTNTYTYTYTINK